MREAAKLDYARGLLDVRPWRDIQREIDQARAAFARLKASGQLSTGELAQAFAHLQNRIVDLKSQTNGWADALDKVKTGLAGFAGGIAVFALGVRNAASFEAAMVSTQRAAGLTREETAKLGNEFQRMSTRIAVGANDIAVLCARMGVRCRIDPSIDGMTVHGYMITRQMPARVALESLLQPYLIDCYEDGDTLVFVRRGGAVKATYAIDALAAHEHGDDPPDPLPIRRGAELELPRRISVQYIDPSRDYEPDVQYASRIATTSQAETGLDLPIAMEADEAARIAERLLIAAWIGRDVYGPIWLPYTGVGLNPTDVIRIDDGAETHRIRLTRVEYQSSGLMQCHGAAEVYGQYDISDAVHAVPGSGFSPSPPPRASGEVIMHWIDGPLLQDTHPPSGVYVCAAAQGGPYRGAMLQISYDGGTTWTDAAWMAVDAIVGQCPIVLGDHPATVIDRASTLRVNLVDPTDELTSISHDTALARTQNVALVGDEVIVFESAELVSPGVYDLRVLHRGLRGTDVHTGSHAGVERFVLLSPATVYHVAIADSHIGSTLRYRVVPGGAEPGGQPDIYMPYRGRRHWPYAVAHLAAAPAGAGEYHVTWVRRSRIDGEWRDLVDVPIGEASESYRVDVHDGPTLTHSQTVTTTSATVPAAPGHTITVRQISAVTGTGHSRSITL